MRNAIAAALALLIGGVAIARNAPEFAVIPSTDFTISDYIVNPEISDGPYTNPLGGTQITSCSTTTSCTVNISQYVGAGAAEATGRWMQTDAGGYFEAVIDNGTGLQVAGTTLTVIGTVHGTALAGGQKIYAGPLPGTAIVSGTGPYTVNTSQYVNLQVLSNQNGLCFLGHIDNGSGAPGTTLTVSSADQCIPASQGTPGSVAIGDKIYGGVNDTNVYAGLENQGAFRFECAHSHLAYDDPVIAPGIQGGSSHLHDFFGNTLANYASNYTSLRTTGGGSCAGGPINRTGYWFPALHDPSGFSGAGAIVTPDFVTLYYKGDRTQAHAKVAPGSGVTMQQMVQLHRGLRYISGFNVKDDVMHEGHFWGCEDLSEVGAPGYTQPSDLPTLWGYLQALGITTTACPRIFARMDAGDCWNGNLDSSDHFSHVVYGQQDSFGHVVCPSDHPYPIPFVSFIVWFERGTTDFSGWYLDSDRMPGHETYANGYSWHVDWFGAWDYAEMERWMAHCLQIPARLDPSIVVNNNDTQNSSAGVLCDGTGLSYAGGTTGDGYVSPPVTLTPSIFPAAEVAVPPRP